jgi:hypothetical protein
MLTVLGLLFISIVIIPYLVYIGNDKSKEFGAVWGVISTIIASAIIIIMWSNSYNTYVNMKKDAANFEIYADTITSYEKLAVLDTKNLKSELTDLKYQNYQNSIKELVKDLRNSCVNYNRILAGKEAFGNNIIFSWLIVMPDDDMNIVKFSDFLNVENR